MIENQQSELPDGTSTQSESTNLISDEQLLGVYGEMLDLIRQDRVEVSGILNDFLEMVINNGDASSASKEAIVQLMKVKTDCVGNMRGVADLLKDRDTFPAYLNGKTQITVGNSKKDLIKQLNQMQKKGAK